MKLWEKTASGLVFLRSAPAWDFLRRALANEAGHIAMPGPLKPYPAPRGATDLLLGARPERVVIGLGANPKIVKRGPGAVAWLLVFSTAAAVAYLVDTNADNDTEVTKRKMPAACPAADMGGWMAPDRALAPIMYSGAGVFCADTTAEVFIGLID